MANVVFVKTKRIVTNITSQHKFKILVILSHLLFIHNGTSGRRPRSGFMPSMTSMKIAKHQAESGREADRATL